MKKYFANLRPLERRLVVGVAVGVVLILNWWFVWPHFSDLGDYESRFDSATVKLKNYRANVAQIPQLQEQLKKYESQGEYVAQEDQGVNLIRTIQMQSAQSGVALQSSSPAVTHTNDAFFVELEQNINVLAPEEQLVDFLYHLGSDASMIRVRDLTLQPDPPHQRLSANIRLVASYQKSPANAAAKNTTVKK
jgi:Tfp pilus assembly protein PilO